MAPVIDAHQLEDYTSMTSPLHPPIMTDRNIGTSVHLSAVELEEQKEYMISKHPRQQGADVSVSRKPQAVSTAPTGERQLNLRRGSQRHSNRRVQESACGYPETSTALHIPISIQKCSSKSIVTPTRQRCLPYKMRTTAFAITVFGSNSRFSARLGKNSLFLTSTLSSEGPSPNGAASCWDNAGKRQVATFFV
jgi:hypothetical protein